MQLQSLYRTYRPQRWSDLVGQDLIVTTLTNEIAHDTLVHAYLFTGTRGVGKTTTARLLAKTVNCEKRKKNDVEPCNSCASCTSITDGRSLDVVEIDAASHTGVDNVRENIIAASRVSPLERRMKVFIIDEVHMLSTAAFNALLKTLEEPSSNVVFILATTDIDRVPDTIISRCQRFDFRRVGNEAITKRLTMLGDAEKVSLSEDVVEGLIRYADGSLRDAESMLGQLLGLGKKKITMEDAAMLLPRGDAERAREFLGLLRAHSVSEALALIDDCRERGVDAQVFLQDCIHAARTLLLAALQEKNIGAHEEIVALLRHLLASARDAAIMQPPVLALELLVAAYALPHTHDVAPIKKYEKSKEFKEDEAPSPKKSDASSSLLLSAIHERWKEVLAVSKKHNHSLALILKVATPVSIAGDVVTLGFRYAFHADRLDDLATKKIARRILEEVFARPLDVRTSVVQSEGTAAPQPATSFVSDILSTFGGKVVKRGDAGA